MKWHYLLVSVCLGVLAITRIGSGNILSALLLVLVSALYLWAFFKSAQLRKKVVDENKGPDVKESSAKKPFKPTEAQLKNFIEVYRKIANKWLVLSVIAAALSLAGILILRYPPFSIFMVIIGIYCTFRYRKSIGMIRRARFALNNLDE